MTGEAFMFVCICSTHHLAEPVEVLHVYDNASLHHTRTTLHRMTRSSGSGDHANLGVDFNMCRNVIKGMRGARVRPHRQYSSINGQKVEIGQVQLLRREGGRASASPRRWRWRRARRHHRELDMPGLHRHRDGVGGAEEGLEKMHILPLIPIGRLGEPEEIARCVVFLASDDAGLITGSTLSANGGQYFA